MEGWGPLVAGIYAFSLLCLAAFGVHRYSLLYLYLKKRNDAPRSPEREGELPFVTVQLPIYNERYVVDRLLRSVARIRWPRDRFEIQVLDDSTDETGDALAAVVDELRGEGLDIRTIHRTVRTGFKAGALQEGLAVAKGELVAVFDADFCPEPDFLEKVTPHFVDESVGMVQTRWSHINRAFSLLTRIQSILLDGHFVVEHTARSRTGRFFNFNGTAGVWRKSCIESAGGWEADTLTEDLDLSYRAQLEGWRFVYLKDVTSPAELPVEMNAFKSQQHRWAKGSIQTAFKVLPRVWRSTVPLKAKLEATIHLTSNVAYTLMLVPVLFMLPMLILQSRYEGYQAFLFYLVVFFFSTLSVVFFYLAAERDATGSARPHIKYIPCLMSLGIGMSINNARAVLEALFRKETPFLRTPKFNVTGKGGAWKGMKYRSRRSLFSFVEVLLGLYFLLSLVFAIHAGLFAAVPFLLLFLFGFLYVGGLSLWQRAG